MATPAQHLEHGQQAGDGDGDGQRVCTRGHWCAGLTVRKHDDGTTTWDPAPTYRAFCFACEAAITGALGTLPEAWAMLRLWGLEPGRTGRAVRVAAGSRLPLAAGADAVMRAIPDNLASWEVRLRGVPGLTLSAAGTQQARAKVRRIHAADGTAAVRWALAQLKKTGRLLGEYVGPLLALEPGPMPRPTSDGVGWADLGGVDAGAEILRMGHQARAWLGFVRGRPEWFDGVPCKQCGQMGLERAPLPARSDEEAMRSRCPRCADLMPDAQFDLWVKWYAGWAQTSGVACRRCQRGDCPDCQWYACDCRGRGHQAAALTAGFPSEGAEWYPPRVGGNHMDSSDSERPPPEHWSTGRLTPTQAAVVERWRARLLEDRPLPGHDPKPAALRLLGIDDRPRASCSDVLACAVTALLGSSHMDTSGGALDVARAAETARLAAALGRAGAPVCQPVSFYLPADVAERGHQVRDRARQEAAEERRRLWGEAETRHPGDEKAQETWVMAELRRAGLPWGVRQVPRGVIARMAIDRWARRNVDDVCAAAEDYAADAHEQVHRARRDMRKLPPRG